ncbi:MAG TPA: methyl-accepting chemotaxis protein [Bacillota bacterium]|nr:methyl-accepting chemotaxis protein [Bacillota bacterium]
MLGNWLKKAVVAIIGFFGFRSVVSKIIGILLLTSFFTVVVGSVGLIKINQMNDVAKDIYNKNTSTLIPLDDLLQSLYLMNEYASRAVLRNDSNAVSSLSTNINNTNGQFSSFQYTLPDRTYQEMAKHWNRYYSSVRDLYNDLSRGGANASTLYVRFQNESDSFYSYIYTLGRKLRIAGADSFSNGKKIYDSALMLQALFTGVGFIIAVLVGFWIALSILGPLRQLQNKTELLAEGNLKVQIDIQADEEINAVNRAFNKAVDELRSMVTRSIDYSNQLNVSCDDIFRAAEGASQTLSNINQLVEDLTKGASIQSNTVEQTIESVQKASEGSNSVIKATLAINVVCQEASAVTNSGSQAVTDLIKTVDNLVSTVNEIDVVIQELSTDSKQILQFSEMIGEIADQTTLLALNASIEAARAGDGSKGFSVIADHVGELAARSEESAKHINKVVKLILEKTEKAVEVAKLGTQGAAAGRNNILQTVNLFKNLVERLDKITTSIGHIADISSQMGESNKTVIKEMGTISEISQSNLAAAEEVSATFEEQYSSMMVVADAARQLRELAQQLWSAAERFVI